MVSRSMLEPTKLRELLVLPGHIAAEQFDAPAAAAATAGTHLPTGLVGNGLIRDADLGQLVAEAYGVKFFNLAQEQIDVETMLTVPEAAARSRGLIVWRSDKDGLRVAMRDPDDAEMRHWLEKKSGQPVQRYYLTAKQLAEALNYYRGEIKKEVESLIAHLSGNLIESEKEKSLIALVDAILSYGHENKASDIHLEPYRDHALVRLRIDGVMHDVLTLPRALGEMVLARLKIMAKLRTDEHRAALDGKLQFKFQNEPVDVRISIVPVTEGENAVLRLLSEASRRFTLSDLGLQSPDEGRVRQAIDNPHGMILVTGPTGSGKTTTVYAMLKVLNQRDVHISTIEDPVEYSVEGVSQIQVNAKTGLTFASGLRSIVRQDPDIIMVGEIRDRETAGIAVNSAMTGHLVLSTLHANDAATTLPRRLDMGIEPYFVASTVNVLIGQRLVRALCPSCRASRAPTEDEIKAIDGDLEVKKILAAQGHDDLAKITLYRGGGCHVCHGSGYVGRIGIFEVLLLTESVKSLVVARVPSDSILAAARRDGMTTMLEDGVQKVLSGATALEEVLRVVKV